MLRKSVIFRYRTVNIEKYSLKYSVRLNEVINVMIHKIYIFTNVRVFEMYVDVQKFHIDFLNFC